MNIERCPFCGSLKAEVVTFQDGGTSEEDPYKKNWSVAVKCECGASGPFFSKRFPGAEENAVEFWNNRFSRIKGVEL